MEATIQVRTAAVLLLAAFFLAACFPNNDVESGVSVSAFPTFTNAPQTPTLIPSQTPEPTLTATPTFSPSPTTTPTFTPSPTATTDPCWAAGGKVTSYTLATDLSPLPWEFRIYTPPCYDSQAERAYPLLILIHGSTYNDSQWDDLGADERADEMIQSGEAPPFIILMPRDRVWIEPNEDPFGEALVTRILPWVDANFRTIPDRDHRSIGGLSRGASWAIHLGLKYWTEFSAIGGHSLPVFLTDPPRIRAWLDAIPEGSMPRFYLDIGDKDYLLDKALWFENLLTELNIPHEWYLNSGRHEDTYWAEHVYQYLIWYTAAW